jgi:hypothetical protein
MRCRRRDVLESVGDADARCIVAKEGASDRVGARLEAPGHWSEERRLLTPPPWEACGRIIGTAGDKVKSYFLGQAISLAATTVVTRPAPATKPRSTCDSSSRGWKKLGIIMMGGQLPTGLGGIQ